MRLGQVGYAALGGVYGIAGALVVVAAGLTAFGVFCLFDARFRRA